MTLFESKLCDLLTRCEEILKPIQFTTEKWQVESDTQMITVVMVDEVQSIAVAFAIAQNEIQSMKEYVEAESLFTRDKVFGAASSTAGHWAKFDGFLGVLLRHSASLHKGQIRIDYARAVQYSTDFRDTLERKLIKFTASVRLFGAGLTQKSFALSDGVTLHRLTRQERNDRMPTIEPYWSGGPMDYVQLGHSKCEMRTTLSVVVDHSKQNAHFTAHNEGRRLALEVFTSVMGAIQLAKGGRVLLGDIKLSGGVPGISTGHAIRTERAPESNVKIGQSDIPMIRAAYQVVTGGTGSDKILQRSTHRFLLGRKRQDYLDKLVDYVVAWESLLLTSGGNPIAQEMSYRFALNGASLISQTKTKSGPRELNAKLRGSYLVRSKIVHGGSEKEITKALTSADFANNVDLCNFLESHYRRVVFWLHSLPRRSRPYIRANGWEELIWPK